MLEKKTCLIIFDCYNYYSLQPLKLLLLNIEIWDTDCFPFFTEAYSLSYQHSTANIRFDTAKNGIKQNCSSLRAFRSPYPQGSRSADHAAGGEGLRERQVLAAAEERALQQGRPEEEDDVLRRAGRKRPRGTRPEGEEASLCSRLCRHASERLRWLLPDLRKSHEDELLSFTDLWANSREIQINVTLAFTPFHCGHSAEQE